MSRSTAVTLPIAARLNTRWSLLIAAALLPRGARSPLLAPSRRRARPTRAARRSPSGSQACAPKRSRAASARRSSTRRSATSTSRCRSSSSAIARRRKPSCRSRHTSARRLTPTVVATGREMLARHRALARRGRRAHTACRRGSSSPSGASSRTSAVQRRAADGRRAGDAGLGSAARDASFAASCSTRSRSSTAATSSSRDMQRLVGGRDGPAAVHAVELSEVRRGLRRRRPARHLAIAGRHLRVDRQLPEGRTAGWPARRGDARSTVSPEAAAESPATSRARSGTCQATRNMTVALPLQRWQRLGVRLP